MTVPYISPRNRLYDFLSDTGVETTGSLEAIGDYSVTPQDFWIQPPTGWIYQINRIIGAIVDTGTFDSGSYGNGITLTNGIVTGFGVWVEEQNQIVETSISIPIVRTTDWKRYCYDFDLSNFGQGDNTASFRWTFSRGGGQDSQPIYLDGDRGEKIFVRLNDDFTGLVSHTFQCQGLRYKK